MCLSVWGSSQVGWELLAGEKMLAGGWVGFWWEIFLGGGGLLGPMGYQLTMMRLVEKKMFFHPSGKPPKEVVHLHLKTFSLKRLS